MKQFAIDDFEILEDVGMGWFICSKDRFLRPDGAFADNVFITSLLEIKFSPSISNSKADLDDFYFTTKEYADAALHVYFKLCAQTSIKNSSVVTSKPLFED